MSAKTVEPIRTRMFKRSAVSVRPSQDFNFRRSFLLLLACCLLGISTAAYAGPYTLKNLGSLGGNTSVATAINDSGWVVGYAKDATDLERAAVWDPTNNAYSIIELGAPGLSGRCLAINSAGQVAGNSGQSAFLWDTTTQVLVDVGVPLGWDSSTAVGLNEAGQITGYLTAPGGVLSGFIWDATNGLVQELGSLPNCTYIQPKAINNAGQIVGIYYVTGEEVERGFIWDGTQPIRDIGNLGGTRVSPNAINNLGHVVGSAETAFGETHAFFWDGVMDDLDTLGGSNSGAFDINDAGQIVGLSSLAGDSIFHAFICDESHVLNDIGSLPGGAFAFSIAINEAGLVTGISDVAAGAGVETHAMFWDLARGMVDLGTLGGNNSQATALNNLSQIVGLATTADYQTRAFLVDVSSLPPQGVQQATVSTLTAARTAATQPQDIRALDQILKDLTKTQAPALWVDSTHLNARTGDTLFNANAKVVGDCLSLVRGTKDLIPDALLLDVVEDLVNNSENVAKTAVDEAAALLGIPMQMALRTLNTPKESKASKMLAEARKELARAESQVARGKYQEAIKAYGKAWKKAQEAMRRI